MRWEEVVPDGAGFTVHELTPVLLVASLTLIVAAAAVRLSARSGFPSLLLYLGLGLLLGQGGLGIPFDSPELARALGYAALVLILIEGGLTTQWDSIRRSVAPAAMLSTVGVLVSIAVVALAARYLLQLSWHSSVLIGAIMASTDAAAVFSVLRRVPLPRRITGMLEAESGFNDAPVVILVTALVAAASETSTSAGTWLALGGLAVVELVGGTVIGVAIGWLGARFLTRVAASSSGLFALSVVAMAVLAYAAASTVHTSGFIACYLAALVLGNARMPHLPAVHAFGAALGWLAQIGLFVMLGMLVVPDRLMLQIVPAIIIGLVLLLVARPLSVAVSLTPFRVPWQEQVFLSWAGLRGAVPIVLATVPMASPTLHIDWMLHLVFVLVVIFTLIQAPTLAWIAGRLGVAEAYSSTEVALDSMPLDDLNAEMLQVHIGERSRLAGVEVAELRLPTGANVTLVVRDGVGLVPDPSTPLRHGDDLLIVTTSQVRDRTEKRIRAVSRQGRLAGWGPAQPPEA